MLLPQQRHGELKWMTILGPLFQGCWRGTWRGGPGACSPLSSSYRAGEPLASFSAPLCSIKPGPVYTSENAVHTSGAT